MAQSILAKCFPTLLECGDVILSIYNSDFSVKDKGVNDPVTEADLKANSILENFIRSQFSDHGFLSEETKDSDERLSKENVWILDPIDGTREFVAKNPEFALSLGLSQNGKVVLGIIFNPATGEMFLKERGGELISLTLQAPYRNYSISELEPKQGNRATNPKELKKPKLMVSFSEFKAGLFSDPFWENEFQIKPVGSIAYKLGLLSSGNCDLVISFKPKNEWDICGGFGLLDDRIFSFFPLEEKEVYTFNNQNTRSYGLVAGTKPAIEFLLSKKPIDSLKTCVSKSW